MRVAFIPSAYKTIFAHALAAGLEARGHEIFWVCPNKRWSRWLFEHGVAPDKVLDITNHADEWTQPGDTTSDRAQLAALERRSAWRIYDLIASDHLLAERDTEYAIRYLAACARRVEEFMRRHRIELVSGELTWAFEQIVGQVCISLDVPYMRPMMVRIPDGRTAFFGSRFEAEIVELREPAGEDRAQARAFLQEYRKRPRPPVYMQMNWSVLRANAERLALLTKHAIDLASDPHDETSRRPLGLIADHSMRVLRTNKNLRLGPFEQATETPPRPFVLMTLHQQPEATIDVMASPFCNQVECARALARSLPVTHDLYVKEHMVALAWRTRGFYDELRAIPGVKLIDPRASTFALIRQASAVVAATGTSTYEASLLGIPAVTFGPTVFSKILVSDHFNPFSDSLADLLEKYAGKPPRSDAELHQFLAWLLANSIPGIVGDALWESFVMEPGYATNVAGGFALAMERACAQRRAP